MGTIGTLPGDRLAGLSADLFHKVQKGVISIDELALFTQRKNPFVLSTFERNEHGHIVLTFDGLDLTGSEEVERRFHMSDKAMSCLLSTKKDGYDKNHHLATGMSHKIALMPTREIGDSDRTTEALRKRGIEKYGYEKPRAGIIPRICESVSDKQMEEMGFWYIVAPHEPITDSDGDPGVLGVGRSSDGPWLRAFFGRPDDRWHNSGAFAFLVPAS